MQTIDDFLGGQVRLIQESEGLRATSDSVLLAASVPVRDGETVLDVGMGNGVIPLCLNVRVPNLNFTGIECQPDLCDLACQNANRNHCALRIVQADISVRPSPIHGQQYHHVVTNPPFYNEPFGRHCKQVKIAYQQQMPLYDWLSFCLRHVRAKGSLTLIHRPEALPEIIAALDGRLRGLEIFPIMSKSDEPAKRIIVRGYMNAKAPLKLYPPLIMHTPDNQRTMVAEALLRQGRGLDEVIKTT
ncbi:MAG: methyltransferase [Alphaproteobacteria bacterium]|nr:methyltransferase [Alphaproteobacteria bacterium]